VSGAVLLAWIAIFTAPSVDAAEPARDAGAKADAADRLNHQQAALEGYAAGAAFQRRHRGGGRPVLA
jgi:hypothetical protein